MDPDSIHATIVAAIRGQAGTSNPDGNETREKSAACKQHGQDTRWRESIYLHSMTNDLKQMYSINKLQMDTIN
jgi:hypothetical protein